MKNKWGNKGNPWKGVQYAPTIMLRGTTEHDADLLRQYQLSNWDKIKSAQDYHTFLMSYDSFSMIRPSLEEAYLEFKKQKGTV